MVNRVSSINHTLGPPLPTAEKNQPLMNYDDDDDDDDEMFCFVCSVLTLYDITIKFIGDSLLVLIQPVYVILISVEVKNDTLSNINNTNLSQLVNHDYENKTSNLSSLNDSTTEYSEILLEMLPQLLSLFENNEVDIMTPYEEVLPKVDVTTPTIPTTIMTDGTTTTTTTTMTTTPPPPPVEEEKGFFDKVVDVFSNFLG